MPPAAAGHASRADLALLRELTADTAEVLVVDDVDLVPAIRAGLAPACAGRSLSIAAAPAARAAGAAAGLLPTARFTCHLLRSPHRFQRKSPRSRDSEECIGRKADRLPAALVHVGPAFHVRARDQPPGCRLERDVVVSDATAGRCRGEVGGIRRHVALRREAVAIAAAAVTAAAEELDGVSDDLDGLALARAIGRVPLAPVKAAVDGNAAALLEVLSAVLALRAPDGHVEVVGLVDPLPGSVLATRVHGDAQLAD